MEYAISDKESRKNVYRIVIMSRKSARSKNKGDSEKYIA